MIRNGVELFQVWNLSNLETICVYFKLPYGLGLLQCYQAKEERFGTGIKKPVDLS